MRTKIDQSQSRFWHSESRKTTRNVLDVGWTWPHGIFSHGKKLMMPEVETILQPSHQDLSHRISKLLFPYIILYLHMSTCPFEKWSSMIKLKMWFWKSPISTLLYVSHRFCCSCDAEPAAAAGSLASRAAWKSSAQPMWNTSRWMVYNGKSKNRMDDLGVPLF